MLLSIFKFVGPEIKVVSKPFFDSDFAISYPCLPLDLFVINLIGSIYSFVGPAVTIAFNLLFIFIFQNNFLFLLIFLIGSDIFPSPYSPHAISPISGPINL